LPVLFGGPARFFIKCKHFSGESAGFGILRKYNKRTVM
jgi:hypothetical protein